MASTTIGVKIDDGLRTRLKSAAEALGRSPHWLIKQSIVSILERIERGDAIADLPPASALTNGNDLTRHFEPR